MRFFSRVWQAWYADPIAFLIKGFPLLILINIFPIAANGVFFALESIDRGWLNPVGKSIDWYYSSGFIFILYIFGIWFIYYIVNTFISCSYEAAAEYLAKNYKRFFLIFVLYHLFWGGFGVIPIRYYFNLELSAIVPDLLINCIAIVLLFGASEPFRDRFLLLLSDSSERADDAQVVGTRSIDPVVLEIRSRARLLKSGSLGVLFLICLMLFAASVIIFQTIDETRIDAPQTELGKLTDNRNKAQEEMTDYKSKLLIMLPAQLDIQLFEGDRINTEFVIKNIKSLVISDDYRETLLRLIQDYDRSLQRRIGLDDRISQLPDDTGTLSAKERYVYNIVQVVGVRVSFVILILFFVKLLFNLYRYISRLGASYSSQADAIEIMEYDFDAEDLSTLFSALSPEKYDFGKAPSSPISEAVKIIQAVKGAGEK